MRVAGRLFKMMTGASLSHQQRLDFLFASFFIHLILTVWSSLCGCLPQSFLLYNGIFLLTLVWSLHQRESEEAPFLAMCTDLLSILFDVVNLCLFWPVLLTGSMRFGAAAAVLNLTLRPCTAFLLYRILQDRTGSQNGGAAGGGIGGSGGGGVGKGACLPTGFTGILGGSVVTGKYQDIDHSRSVTQHQDDPESAATPPPRPPPPVASRTSTLSKPGKNEGSPLLN